MHFALQNALERHDFLGRIFFNGAKNDKTRMQIKETADTN